MSSFSSDMLRNLEVIFVLVTRKCQTDWRSMIFLGQTVNWSWRANQHPKAGEIEISDWATKVCSPGIKSTKAQWMGTLKWQFWWIVRGWIWASIRLRNPSGPHFLGVTHMITDLSSTSFESFWVLTARSPEKLPPDSGRGNVRVTIGKYSHGFSVTKACSWERTSPECSSKTLFQLGKWNTSASSSFLSHPRVVVRRRVKGEKGFKDWTGNTATKTGVGRRDKVILL